MQCRNAGSMRACCDTVDALQHMNRLTFGSCFGAGSRPALTAFSASFAAFSRRIRFSFCMSKHQLWFRLVSSQWDAAGSTCVAQSQAFRRMDVCAARRWRLRRRGNASKSACSHLTA